LLEELLEQYLKSLTNTFQRGDAREESYYTNLDELIKKMAAMLKVKNIDVTILPKKTEAGNPDFRIWDGKNHITGYIEAKDPSVTNLDYIEGTEQLKKSVAFVKENGNEYMDLYGRALVDIAIDLITGFLLVRVRKSRK